MALRKPTATETAIGLYGVLLICLFISGVCLLSPQDKEIRKEFIVNYTDCIKFDVLEQTCKEYLTEAGNAGSCLCEVDFELKEDLRGSVAMFYELDSYRDFIKRYVMSRDPSQWSGEPAAIPSEDCEPFRFTNTSDGMKPILPCGELADAMFNDTAYLYNQTYASVATVETGLLPESRKVKFQNPSAPKAFENFTKPINWRKPIWKLSESDPENNGFKNERFIGWMETDLIRKPLSRINHTAKGFETGLPKGKYKFRIKFNYPPSRYNGTRRIIFEAIEKQPDGAPGGILLGFFFLLLIAGLAFYVLYRRRDSLSHLNIFGRIKKVDVPRPNDAPPVDPKRRSIELEETEPFDSRTPKRD